MKIDTSKVEEWLNSQWLGPKQCPVCGNNDWLIFPRAYEMREYQGGDFVMPGSVVPLVAVMCNVCGHTLLFNGLALRVVERAKGGGES